MPMSITATEVNDSLLGKVHGGYRWMMAVDAEALKFEPTDLCQKRY